MMEFACYHCDHPVPVQSPLRWDKKLGWFTSCPVCGCINTQIGPEKRIKMFFIDDSDPNTAFADYFDGAAICSYYSFDTPKEFIDKWKEVSENPDSMWYWCYDGEIKDENLFCSGACDPNDIEIFMSYFFCNEDGIAYPKAEERNPKYSYWIYDSTEDRLYPDDEDLYWGRKLVYQKKRNTLLYDAATNKPLVPQPVCYARHLLCRGHHLAAKYIPAELSDRAS